MVDAKYSRNCKIDVETGVLLKLHDSSPESIDDENSLNEAAIDLKELK